MDGIRSFFHGDVFARKAGVELLEAGSGYAKARMLITPSHLNGGGVCQGGALFTLADFAFAVAVNSRAKLTLSVSATVHFFRPESSGYIIAEARETYDHQRLAGCEVRLTNEAGELVAMFTSVGYRKNTILPFAPLE